MEFMKIIYIDSANIILSARNYGLGFDMLKLIRHLKDKFRTEDIIYFSGDFKSQQKLFESLKRIGVELVLKRGLQRKRKNESKLRC